MFRPSFRTFVAAALGAVLASGCMLAIDEARIGGGRTGGEAKVEPETSETGDDAGGALDAGGLDLGPLAASLVGAWTFDEGSGRRARDRSGNDHDAILSAGTAAAFGAPGIRGGAVKFAGGPEELHVGTLDDATFPSSGTLSLWFRWNEMDPANSLSIFDDWTPERDHLFLRHENGTAEGAFQLGFQRNSPDTVVPLAFEHRFDVPASTWTHVVVTWDEPTRAVSVFLDDALAKEGTFDASFSPSAQRFVMGRTLVGAIDEVLVFDRALTGAEVRKLPR